MVQNRKFNREKNTPPNKVQNGKWGYAPHLRLHQPMKPFKVGDEVKVQGFWAYVHEIQIFHTVLKNFDQTKLILSNSVIMNGTIENLSDTPTRSMFIKMNVPYGEDLDRVEKLIIEAAHSVPKVDKERKPFLWIPPSWHSFMHRKYFFGENGNVFSRRRILFICKA